ncbi:MAG: hypothetical protein AAF570_11425, partial [Bacteroidota bacterium]
GGAADSAKAKAPEVVKVEPQDFPVNELPETQFGKSTTEAEDGSVAKPVANNFSRFPNDVPAWLEAIISRESIVIFASRVLSEMPDEVEFIQAGQSHYSTADESWKAFVTTFTTRPSNAYITIYGAYADEDKSYWASHFSKDGPLNIEIMDAAPTEGGVILKGIRNVGNNAQEAYEAELKKASTSIKTSKIGG